MGLDYKSWKQIKLEAKQDEIQRAKHELHLLEYDLYKIEHNLDDITPSDKPVKSTLKDYWRVSKLLAFDYLAMKIAKYIIIFIACVFIYCLAVSIFTK